MSSQAQSYNPPPDRPLRIRTFGGLSFSEAGGDSIDEAAALRRPAALLVAVAVAGDRGITRDKLLGLLWPESQPDRARHSLTQAIYAARRATRIDDLFRTTGGLRLNRDRVASDIEDFERALSDGDLERAVALYEGPFLDGFYVADAVDFEQWVSTQRARFEDRVVAALETLAQRASQSGDDRQGLEWRRRLASIRPLDSTHAAAMVMALAQAGDRAGALQHARDHVTSLKEQLDLEPDPAFVTMIEHLREPVVSAGQIELAATVVAKSSATVPTAFSDDRRPAPATAVLAPPSLRFGGRSVARARRGWGLGVAAAGVLLSIVAARAALPHLAAPHSRTTAAPLLFVAPFDVSGASPDVAHLGRGVMRLLADRLGEVRQRPIDGALITAVWRRSGFDKMRDVPRDSILRAAEREGAARVIVGSVIGGREHAVVSATALTVDGTVIATAAVEGAADSISQLTTRLAAKLLVAQAGEDSSVARWDASLPALRAFLDGRAAYRREDYTAALHAFEAALRLDSTFVLAGLQIARAADRIGDIDAEDGALARVWPYRGVLDAGERTQLIALAGPSYPDPSGVTAQLAAWTSVVRAAPSRPASWYELGARLIHDGRRLGVESANEQALIALNRALLLDPGYTPARDLLAHLALRSGGRSDGASPWPGNASASALAPFLQWRATIGRGDSTGLADIRSRFPSMSRENLRAVAMASQFDAVGLRDGRRAIQLLEARATTTHQRVEAVLAAHSFALNLGRSADAVSLTTRLRTLRPDSHAYLRLRVLDALYGAGDTVAAANAARQLAVPVDSLFGRLPLVRNRVAADACVLAQWRIAHGDTSNIRAIVALLRGPDMRLDDQPVSAAPHACGDLLEASLAVATKQPNALALVDRLDGFVLTSAVAGNVSQYANLAVSRMFTTLGHPRRALAALRKRAYMAGWPAYLGATWQSESRLAQTTGDVRRATTSHQRFSALRTVAAAMSSGAPQP